MLTYCYTLTPDDNGTLLVEFPDIPEVAAVAEDEQHAREQGLDGLEVALQLYIDARRPVPMPAATGQGSVTLPALVTAKVLLSNEMVRQGIRKSEMARLLDAHMPQIDRLLDLSHGSKLDQIEAALQQLGKRLEVSLA
jgi:antitoxin HicB